MVNKLAFLERLSHSPIHTHIHTLIAEADMQGTNHSSGAGDLWIASCITSWATTAPDTSYSYNSNMQIPQKM